MSSAAETEVRVRIREQEAGARSYSRPGPRAVWEGHGSIGVWAKSWLRGALSEFIGSLRGHPLANAQRPHATHGAGDCPGRREEEMMTVLPEGFATQEGNDLLLDDDNFHEP